MIGGEDVKSEWDVSYNPSAGEYGSEYLTSKDKALQIADRLNKAAKEGT